MQIVISAGRINDTLFPTIKQTYGKTGGGNITDRTDGHLVFEGFINAGNYSPLLKAKAEYEKQLFI